MYRHRLPRAWATICAHRHRARDCSKDRNDPDAWTWTPDIGDKADGAKYTFGIDPAGAHAPGAAACTCIYDGYLAIGEYNDVGDLARGAMFSQDFGFPARNPSSR